MAAAAKSPIRKVGKYLRLDARGKRKSQWQLGIFEGYVFDFALDRMQAGERIAIVTLSSLLVEDCRPAVTSIAF